MNDHLDKKSIRTPKGGKELLLLHVCKNDDIIGFFKFEEEASLLEFKEAFRPLLEKGWGTILLEIDKKEKP